jgi:Spy/CpxP family protein refolding chaperone
MGVQNVRGPNCWGRHARPGFEALRGRISEGKPVTRAARFIAIAVIALPIIGFAASPYVGEQTRSLKALSEQEVAEYLTGKGMGLAKAAELNGYPGPAHVLELADQLALSPTQKDRTEKVFERMQARARGLGAQLIEEERRLDQLFAAKTVSRDSLAASMSSIGALQSAIRATHLEAHLDEAEILTETQRVQYWRLRGYADIDSGVHHKH